MMLFLITLSTPAHAAYICSLTSADLIDINGHYSMGWTQSKFNVYLTAPFACGPYDDLCELVGPAAAEDWVCDMWSMFKGHSSTSDIYNIMHPALQSLIESNDTVALLPTAGFCPEKKGIEEELWNDTLYRVKVRAKSTDAGVYKSIAGSTRGQWFDTFLNVWFTDSAGTVEIDAAFSSISPNCSESASDEKSPGGYVSVVRADIFTGRPFERVDANGCYWPAGGGPQLCDCAWNVGTWDDEC